MEKTIAAFGHLAVALGLWLASLTVLGLLARLSWEVLHFGWQLI